MDNLLEAYKDYSAMWQLYKEFAQRTPKDDKFSEDLANAPAQIKTTTTLGHLLKIVVLRAISEDDWRKLVFVCCIIYSDNVGIYDYKKWYYIEFEGRHVFICGKYVERI